MDTISFPSGYSSTKNSSTCIKLIFTFNPKQNPLELRNLTGKCDSELSQFEKFDHNIIFEGTDIKHTNRRAHTNLNLTREAWNDKTVNNECI